MSNTLLCEGEGASAALCFSLSLLTVPNPVKVGLIASVFVSSYESSPPAIAKSTLKSAGLGVSGAIAKK